MFRSLLEKKVGRLSDQDLTAVLKMATDDVKFNRISFGKNTHINDLVNILIICFETHKKSSLLAKGH